MSESPISVKTTTSTPQPRYTWDEVCPFMVGVGDAVEVRGFRGIVLAIMRYHGWKINLVDRDGYSKTLQIDRGENILRRRDLRTPPVEEKFSFRTPTMSSGT